MNYWLLSLCTVVVLWLVFVRLYNVFSLDERSAQISSSIESFEDISSGKTASDLSEAQHFAVLSAQVYGTESETGFTRAWKHGCETHKAILDEWTFLRLPTNSPKAPKDKTGEQVKWDSPLVVGVWYRTRADSDIEVALVFRGTDDVGDLYSNLRWITGLWTKGWDQYDMTRTMSQYIEKWILEERFPNTPVRFVSAGHSLGGGLAHQAAYAAEHIRTVYAFDSSSVTGFFSVDKKSRDRSKNGMRIYRIHERGEVLALLRNVMRIVFPVAKKDPKIFEVAYNFDKGGAVGQHSIEKLACSLSRQSVLNSDDGD